MAKRRTPAEREIIYLAAMSGYTREQCNENLRRAGYREVPESSYSMNLKMEGVLLRAKLMALGTLVNAPLPYGSWPREWRIAHASQLLKEA